MRFRQTELPGVILVEPDVYTDERGFFVETYHAPRYRAGGIRETFVQDNHSCSPRGTLRGLHGQFPHCQGKLVRATEGEIFDVAVDARRGSPTYGGFVTAVLSAENFHQFYVPAGFVHGFCVTSDFAQVQYRCTEIYHPQDEFSVAWNDPDLGIPWPVSDPLLSPKDEAAPRLRDVQDRLIEYRPPEPGL
jgi:dTDP-4-dehydrorhamnose 3,5-epimerase